ncbi:MAG: AEC family transporter [Pseudomonadota bacterium]
MTVVFSTIVPIFSVIFLGWLVHRKGLVPPDFLGPANRLVYHLAIPAMIFSAISTADFSARFDPLVLVATLASILLTFVLTWVGALRLPLRRFQIGTFVQCGFHGNLGYIGLAVAYYYLGEKGFAQAGILAGFIMILQNLLAVTVLQVYAPRRSGRGLSIKKTFLHIAMNPVILSSLAGIGFSVAGLTLPVVVSRTLGILSSMALPLALVLIGASLNFGQLRTALSGVAAASVVKLLILPGIGFGIFRYLEMPPALYLPALILLASPTATLTYVMAREIGGDENFAVGAISVCTLMSALTFSFWLQAAG